MTERTKKNNDDQDRNDERRTGPGQGDSQERSTRSGSPGNAQGNRMDDDDDDRDMGNRSDDDTARRSTSNPQKKK
jgi:hypothetical protein